MTLMALLLAVGSTSAADLLWAAPLEADDGGLLSYGQTGQWEWGEVGSGPGSSYDGSTCWGSELHGWYLNDAIDSLEIADLPLSGATRPVLVFQHWYDFAAGDYGILELQQEGAWSSGEPIYGYPAGSAYEGDSDGWQPGWVDLTGFADGDSLRFTIASDAAGAADGWYVDQLELWDGDPVPPAVTLDSCLPDTEDADNPFTVRVTARDDLGLSSVLLSYSIDGAAERHRVMVEGDDDVFEGNIPAQELGSSVSYYVAVSDGENQTIAPTEPCSFEVRLPPPTQLQGPDGVVWGTHAPLSWTAPESAYEVLGYRVYRDDGLVAEVEQPQVEAPVVTGEQSFTVAAVFQQADGAQSEALIVEAAVPTITALEPALGYQGDHLRLRLEGECLLLEQDDLELDLGEGLRVTGIEVRDVDLAFVTIFVAENAPSGLRDLTLWTGDLELVEVEAFEVLSGSERPKLTGVEPETVRQGDEISLLITASDAFADQPTVWLGEHILVEDVALVANDVVEVGVVVPYDTPLGLQDLEVDDGTRIYSGLNLQVRDYIAPVDPDGTCAAAPARAGWVGLLLALVGAALRRRRP